jgi:hypothetical protein
MRINFKSYIIIEHICYGMHYVLIGPFKPVSSICIWSKNFSHSADKKVMPRWRKLTSNNAVPCPCYRVYIPGDLGTRKRPGTSCKIEILFRFKITQYLINSTRFLSQICPRYSFPCARHRHKVSNSFTKESGHDK